MRGIKQIGFWSMAILLFTVLLVPNVFADSENKLSVNGKAFFDVSLGGVPLLEQLNGVYEPADAVVDSMLLLSYLMVINDTYDELSKNQGQGDKVKFVLAFRGPALQFLLKDGADADPNYPDIAAILGSMAEKKGVRLIVCEKTIQSHKNLMELMGLGTDVFLLDSLEVVPNTFVSSMFYQQRNYAAIPIN